MRLSLVLVLFGVACDPESAGDGEVKDTAGDDTAGGGGEVDDWRAGGTGYAYFADGDVDNSIFRLELSRATAPREGFAYFGFVSSPESGLVPVGEIAVSGEDVDHSYDIGENAIVGGFNHFEAWMSEGDGSAPEGEAVWEGNVDTTVFDVIQSLLIASTETTDGDGTLRALESRVEYVVSAAELAADAGMEIAELNTHSEKLANAIETPSDDWDDDGTEETFDSAVAVLGNDDDDGIGLVELIFLDLEAAAGVLDPLDPIRDYIEDAYDGIQFCEFWGERAADEAKNAAATGNTGTAEGKIATVAEEMGWTLTGYDANEDGAIDEETEVGLDWAIQQVSLMARMDVEVAAGE